LIGAFLSFELSTHSKGGGIQFIYSTKKTPDRKANGHTKKKMIL